MNVVSSSASKRSLVRTPWGVGCCSSACLYVATLSVNGICIVVLILCFKLCVIELAYAIDSVHEIKLAVLLTRHGDRYIFP